MRDSFMRLSPGHCHVLVRDAGLGTRDSGPVPAPDPTLPDLRFLAEDIPKALRSFFETVDRVIADNPVDIPRLQALARRAAGGQITDTETRELQSLKLQALRQGRAVGAAIGFFLRFKPHGML